MKQHLLASWASALSARLCEGSLQSGCPSFTPCQALFASRRTWFRLSSCRSSSASRNSRCAQSNVTNRCTSECFASRVQSNQLVSLSWQYALLFPCWVRRTSSPIEIIGRPSESSVTREEIFHLPVSQLLHRGIIGWPLDAPIPASVVIRAVPVVFAVRLVVLLVVGDQVIEREAVVTGHEIHALLGLAFLVAVDLGAADQPVGRGMPPSRRRRGKSCAHRRETARSILSNCPPGSCPPGTGRPRPRLRRSAWCPASTGSESISQSTGGVGIKLPDSSRSRIDARSNRKPSTCISSTQ